MPYEVEDVVVTAAQLAFRHRDKVASSSRSATTNPSACTSANALLMFAPLRRRRVSGNPQETRSSPARAAVAGSATTAPIRAIPGNAPTASRTRGRGRGARGSVVEIFPWQVSQRRCAAQVQPHAQAVVLLGLANSKLLRKQPRTSSLNKLSNSWPPKRLASSVCGDSSPRTMRRGRLIFNRKFSICVSEKGSGDSPTARSTSTGVAQYTHAVASLCTVDQQVEIQVVHRGYRGPPGTSRARRRL